MPPRCAGMTVAMKEGGNLNFLLTDHLGSVAAVTDSAGALLDQQRYMPFGAVRPNVGTITQTDFGYTSQRDLPDMGLMDYKARTYDAYLNRWTQPDTIVPDALNPQALDRYAYTLNNPVRYSDPSGHCVQMEDGFCLRQADNGRYHIVHAERERFANYVEVALADFVLSGDPTSLNRIPSTEALFIGPALEAACAGLGNPCGDQATIRIYILTALTGALGGAYPPPGIGPGAGGAFPRGGIFGDPDCPGCGFTFSSRTPEDILEPGGKPIWTVTGGDPRIGTLGSERQIRAIFRALTVDGTAASRSGTFFEQYDVAGGWVGLRNSRDFGLTIELDILGLNLDTLHLPFH